METTRAHVVALVVLAVYTVAMALIVWHNARTIDSFRVCSDTSGPMLLLLRDLMERTKVKDVCAAVEASAFARMRILVLAADGRPLVDSVGLHEDAEAYAHVTEVARACDADAAPAVVKTTVDGKHVALHACKTKAGVTIAVQTEL